MNLSGTSTQKAYIVLLGLIDVVFWLTAAIQFHTNMQTEAQRREVDILCRNVYLERCFFSVFGDAKVVNGVIFCLITISDVHQHLRDR